MSLDELLNIDVVVTASKKPEDLFETPLSTTIIKKEEILKSGVTSIPEALRLAQGVIVREITPGNYDIHIRGYDDITKNVYLTLPYNTTTLIMIDNRIVYSYFSGGTFWETFPVDINDVERIEVVRGPASALYGPNAVTGVIHVITSHAKKTGMNAIVNGTAGTNKAKNASANIGYNWNDKTKISFSGNFTERRRFDTDYFDFNKNDYVTIDDLTMYLNPTKDRATNEKWTFDKFQEEFGINYNDDISLQKMGGNIFFSHNFSEQSAIDVSTGAQKSQSQKTGFLNFTTPFSQIESESYYFDTKVKYKNLSAQFNMNSGHDYSNYEYNSYRFANVDTNIDYFKQFNSFSVRPGLSYKYLRYNSPLTYDEPLSLNTFNFQFKDKPRISNVFSAYFLSEWKPTQKLRFIGAFRVDKFSVNKNYFANYELAATYRVDKNNLLRFATSRANKSPFFFDSYLNSSLLIEAEYYDETNDYSFNVPVDLKISGQKDLKYPTITNYEVCWRTQFTSKLNFDVEVFYSEVNNFVNPNIYRVFEVVQHVNDAGETDALVSTGVTGSALFENIDLGAYQYGTGFTLNYLYSEKLTAKLYGTFQHTKIQGTNKVVVTTTNIEFGEVTPENTYTTAISSRMNPTQWSEKMTPSFFGGFLLNYQFNPKLNFSTDGYFYSSQTFINYDYYKMMDETKDYSAVQMKIKTNIDLNAKVTYRLNNHLTSSFRIKNIFGSHYEYGFADPIGRMFQIGLSWEL